MTFSLFALYLSLTLAFGGYAPPAVSVSADPWLFISTPGDMLLPGRAVTALTIPGVVWVEWVYPSPWTLAMQTHEFGHVRQIQSLGAPAQALAYALALGQPFEDYRGGQWIPPPWNGRPRCPLFTWSPQGGLSLWACAP